MPVHFRTPGLLESCSAALLRGTLQGLLKPVFSPRCSIAFQRRWLRALALSTWPTPGLQREDAVVGGVPGEWLRMPSRAPATPGCVLYLHGGAFCVGSPATHRALTGRLARATGLPVFALDYRLAPEHPFPAGLDDVLAAYRALRAQGPVLLAGDSAGGGLALSAALALKAAGDPAPAGLYLISPLAELRDGALPAQPVRGEAMLSIAWVQDCRDRYLAGGGDPAQPLCSPLLGDLAGLPPTLIQAGTDELLHAQALALERALQAAGVAVRCEIDERRWHVAQLHGGALASADAAIARAAAFIAPQMAAAREPVPQASHEVLIMGAGMSGLCMAIQLKRAGMHDFVIIEKQQGLGGTWWDNRYPGAHVDVPSPSYAFSFAANPHWTRRCASSQEIQRYTLSLALRFGLLPHLRLGTALQSARFDAPAGRWQLQTDRGDHYSARHFVCSTGPLNQPRWPDIPGLAEFEGQRLHSARWDGEVTLQGRRIAVIGTGSSASQLVAPLAAQAGRLHVFQRTANWVMPRLDRRYFWFDRLLTRLPPYRAAVRWAWIRALDWGRRGFDEGTLARRLMLATAAAHRRRQVPDEALRQQLTPPYPLGCKRIIYSNDFYPALMRPNAELVTAPIERIVRNGIVTADGRERAVDVLVCATGFDTIHLLSSLEIRGLQGRSLAEAWREAPEAYLGCGVAGFPNLHLLLGPNTATGHTSTLPFIEAQVQHALACMREQRRRGAAWLCVKPEAMAAYNAELQGRLQGSVWSQCQSWYRHQNGRVVAIFPGYTPEFGARVRVPDFAAYQFG